MAFQPVPDASEVAVIFTQQSITLQNTFHAELPGGYSFADLQTLADIVDLAIGQDWLPLLPTSCTYDRTEARGLANLNDFVATSTLSSGPGLIAEVPVPNNVTFAVKKLSGQTGRSARGRIYWPAINAGAKDTNENFLQQIKVDQIVAAVEQIRLDIEASQWNPVIVSRFSQGVQRPEGVTFPWVNSEVADNRLDTQRRRLG